MYVREKSLERKQIMKIYLKEQFYVDVSQIVFLLLGRFVDNKVIQLFTYGLFILIRSLRIHKLFDTFIEYRFSILKVFQHFESSIRYTDLIQYVHVRKLCRSFYSLHLAWCWKIRRIGSFLDILL